MTAYAHETEQSKHSPSDDAPLDTPLYPHSRRLSVGLAPTASARRAAVARLDRTGR